MKQARVWNITYTVKRSKEWKKNTKKDPVHLGYIRQQEQSTFYIQTDEHNFRRFLKDQSDGLNILSLSLFVERMRDVCMWLWV